MPSAVRLREDYSAEELRALAWRSKIVNQRGGGFCHCCGQGWDGRGAAAKIAGMDRQTLRDWVHRFNARAPEGLIDHWTEDPKPRLSAEPLAQLAQIVEGGRIVRRTASCAGVGSTSSASSGVDFHPRYVGKLNFPRALKARAAARAKPQAG
jgi:hypothetical protein